MISGKHGDNEHVDQDIARREGYHTLIDQTALCFSSESNSAWRGTHLMPAPVYDATIWKSENHALSVRPA